MAFVTRLTKTVVTSSGGAAEEYVPVDHGLLSQIRYVKAGSGGYDNGVDFVITVESTGEILWDQDDVNASATVAPRQATHTVAGVASVYASTDGVLDKIAIAQDRIKIVIANGGDTKTGTFHFLLV